MANVELSPEAISLIHYTELNRAGWWERGLQRLIVSIIWLCGRTLPEADLKSQLRSVFDVDVDAGALGNQANQLVSAGRLLRLPGGMLTMTTTAIEQLECDIRETERNSEHVRTKFLDLMGRCCPGLNPDHEWQSFNDNMLLPLVREVGARTYELVSGSKLDVEAKARFPQFLARYPAEQQQGIRSAILSLLDPADADVRSYILRLLNAHFVVAASNLDAHTIEALSRTTERPAAFKIFVDTNFLFSFLELHENPSNEAAKSLVELTRQLSGRVACKFYVSPLTVDETKRVIRSHQDFFEGAQFPPNLAEAALEINLTGIAQKFFEFSKNRTAGATAADYFRPYLTDLIPTLRAKDVELFNERMAQYSSDQSIIDEILVQLDYEKKQFPKRCKSYEQLTHDIVLWHMVKSKRPVRVESPLAATFWIVTVDYHFLGYDAYKRRPSSDPVPVCVHPTALIQMLQFWLPRTDKFEEAVLKSFRWPFLFQTFDAEAEQVTSKILATMARFQDVDQLPPVVVKNILLNDALRQRMTTTQDVEKQIELVRSALVEENERVRVALSATTKEKEELAGRLKAKVSEIDTLHQDLREQQSLAKSLKHELEDEKTEHADVSARVRDLEQRLEDQEARRRCASERRRFVLFSLAALCLLLATAAAAARLSLPVSAFWRATLLAWSLCGLIWAYLIHRAANRRDALKTWAPVVQLHQLRRWVIGILGWVVVWRGWELMGSAILAWIKPLTHR